MALKELQLPSIASLRAIAALRSPNLALVRPARIGLGFESAGGTQKTLLEVEDLLGGPGRLSLPYSLRWLLDVMTGLGVLHRTLAFVHGEVQPEHIVLGEDGVGRLMPVVRAHWVRGEERAPERLYYLAPEKLLGDKVDVRSDVFSVGVMLWEALAGQRLLEATDVDDIIARMMGGGIPRAEPLEGEVWTKPLAGIAERAIAVDPGRRFANLAEMRQALETACQRYLASPPGMAELFENPERRARSHVRDSLPPNSQRATVPPDKGAPAVAPPTESQRLDAAAERLSRSSFGSSDDEDDATTIPPPQPVPLPVSKALPVGQPAPSRKTTPRKGGHVNTLLGVPPPPIARRTPLGFEQVKPPSASVVPASTAPTVLTSLSAMNVTVPVGTPAPVITPRPPPPPEPLGPPESVPRSETARIASLSPMVSAHAPPPAVPEPSFELVRPRKSRGAIWLVLGAAVAIGAFAARPWLARQVAAATGSLPFTVPAETAAPTPSPPSSAASAPLADATTPDASAATPVVGIASTPAAPDQAPPSSRRRFGAVEEHVVIDDRHQLQPPTPEPAPEKKPEPVVQPPPPPPPPPPAPKPKPVPVSDADRYGI